MLLSLHRLPLPQTPPRTTSTIIWATCWVIRLSCRCMLLGCIDDIWNACLWTGATHQRSSQRSGSCSLFDKWPQWISAPKPKNEADPKSYLKSLRFIGKHLYIENLNEIKKNDINYDRKQTNYETNSLKIRFCAMTKHQYICIDMLIVPSWLRSALILFLFVFGKWEIIVHCGIRLLTYLLVEGV